MSEMPLPGYDEWKLRCSFDDGDPALDEDGEPIDQYELDARAEDAAIEKAEAQREAEMFDHDNDPARDVW